MLAIFTVLVLITRATSQPCQFENSVPLTDRSYNGVKYLEGEYYVDNITKAERGCICMKETCLRKCCAPREALNSSEFDCVPHPQMIHFPVYTDYSNKQPIEGFNGTENFNFLYEGLECEAAKDELSIEVNLNVANIGVLMDGNLYVEIPSSVPNVYIFGPDKYCIDTFVSDTTEPYLNALICFSLKPKRNNYYFVSSSCMLISCFFILLTVAVYAWLPELRNLHGTVLMAYLLNFSVGFLFSAIMHILILQSQVTQEICTVLTFIVYFSLLAAFFWLNVMCYDIWWTFSGKRAHGGSGSPKKRFMYYAMYAFGFPTALTILLSALEFSDLPFRHPLLPNLRIQGCFLYGNSKLLYLYGPIILICVANMTFYGLTAFNIWKLKKETKVLLDKESSIHDQDRQKAHRLNLYVKLFTVMGIIWTLEVEMDVVISFYPDFDFLWYFFEAYDVLVGLIIFIIFVCKKKTWKIIKKRIKDFQQTDSNSREMNINNVTNKNISRGQVNRDRTASLEMVKTTLDGEEDSRHSGDVTPL